MESLSNLPRHIAIIMDGNGRWAKGRGLPRMMGHRAGGESVDVVVRTCAELGIEALTLFAFSTENWNRSREEVDMLMQMLLESLDSKLEKIQKNRVRFNAIGQLDQLPREVREKIARNIELTQSNSGLKLTLALSYGGRREIIDAVKKLCLAVQEGHFSMNQIDEESFRQFLYAPDLPDPDLLIRTSGEMRLSNFLLWQSAYTELYVTDTLWPDFRRPDLVKAIEAYQRRERRFGRAESLG